jgi:hypothetical protein
MICHFKKKIDCTPQCHDNVTSKVVQLYPEFITGVTGHISISHGKPNHTFWITFYDLGVHENWINSKDGIGTSEQTELNEKQKKYTGKKPNVDEIKNALS